LEALPEEKDIEDYPTLKHIPYFYNGAITHCRQAIESVLDRCVVDEEKLMKLIPDIYCDVPINAQEVFARARLYRTLKMERGKILAKAIAKADIIKIREEHE